MAAETEKNPEGRPLMFKDVSELQEKIEAYFAFCDSKTISVFHKQLDRETGSPVTMEVSTPYTVEGLAEFLGCHRETLLNYKDRPEFFDTITRARDKITRHKIERALIGAYETRFAIFDLINNSSYKNEKAVDHTTGGQPITRVIIE